MSTAAARPEKTPFDRIHHPLRKHLTRLGSTMGVSREDTEDLIQEILIDLLVRMGSPKEPKQIFGWCSVAFRHKWIDQYRRMKRVVYVGDTGLESSQIQDVIEKLSCEFYLYQDLLAEKEKDRIKVFDFIHAEIESIKKPLVKKVIKAYYIHGWRLKDIAKNVQMSEGSCKQALMRFREKMRKNISKSGLFEDTLDQSLRKQRSSS